MIFEKQKKYPLSALVSWTRQIRVPQGQPQLATPTDEARNHCLGYNIFPWEKKTDKEWGCTERFRQSSSSFLAPCGDAGSLAWTWTGAWSFISYLPLNNKLTFSYNPNYDVLIMYWLLVQHFGDYFTIISFKVDQFQIIWNIGGHLGVATRSKRSKTWIFVIFSNYRTPILIWNDPKMYWMVVQHVTQLAFHVYLGNHVSKRPSRGCQMLKIGGKH